MERFNFLRRRFLRLLATVFVIAVTVFALMRVIPGDPALQIAGLNATAEDVANIRQKLGTDRPLSAQFGEWIADICTLDFGKSLISGQKVTDLIFQRFPLTLELALLAMVFAVATGIPVGVLSAVRRDTAWDIAGLLLTQLGLSVPGFWLGILLLLAFAVAIPLFPLFGADGLTALILPAAALGAGFSAVLARHTRNSLIDELSKEYVVAVRAKGLGPYKVVVTHALRNALLPILTMAGIQFGHLLGGAVIIEQVFSLPGIGRLILTAVTQRDFPLVQGSLVFLSIAFSLVNFAVDLLYAVANPRLRIS